jgi:hypothetical protein
VSRARLSLIIQGSILGILVVFAILQGYVQAQRSQAALDAVQRATDELHRTREESQRRTDEFRRLLQPSESAPKPR